MRAPSSLWILRVLWLTLPFTAGELLADQVAGRSGPVRVTALAIGWALWACVGLSAVVALPVGLTGMRLSAPVLAVTTVLTATAGSINAAALIAVVSSTLIAVIAATGSVADHCVDGASYGDERRFSLRLPIGFVVGPVPFAWLVSFGGLIGGALLLAARSWVAGAALVAVGGLATRRSLPSLHGLSKRWLVMVPAGVTLVDHLALAEPVLFPKHRIRSAGLAAVDTDAVDLSGHALGSPIEFRLDRPMEVLRRTGRFDAESTAILSVLVSPASPTAVLRELDDRSGGVFPSRR